METRTALMWALRRAADQVAENPKEYNWNLTSRCNCGLVAAQLLGITSDELAFELATSGFEEGACWTSVGSYVGRMCQQTKLPIPELVKRLAASGLRSWEFDELEDLKNAEVVRVMNRRPEYRDPKDFIEYARTWADLMEKGFAE